MLRGLLGLVLLSLCGCQGCGPPEVVPIDEGERVRRKYAALSALLSPGERRLFDLLVAVSERDRFLEQVGAVAELRIRRALREGMSPDDVARSLGQPEDRETEVKGAARYSYWTYREPVTEQVIVEAVLQFRDGRLIGWEIARDGGE